MERRLAAILAADVVGYTRLMGADESGTLQRLKAQREDVLEPLIAAHRGRIVKLMGDGLLVEFGSIVDAVVCAVAWQEAVAEKEADRAEATRLRFRIGINLGDVIVDGDDIYGDGVNVAARLEGLAEPAGICLSGDAFRQVRGKTEAQFEDLGEREVKNVAEPLRVYRIAGDGPTAASIPPTAETLALPDKPSIAILPFTNMSGDPEQEYFADGVSEDIITALSRVRWFFVIARNSSFAYKGQATDVKQVAQELGIRYVLEGSVRKGGNRVRITAQLADGTTGNQVWARRYDRELADIFDLQDEITETIVGAIEPELGKAERERAKSKRPDNLDAWDLYQRGMSHLYRYTKVDLAEAQGLFRSAVELDPNQGPAYLGLAEAYYYEVVYGFADSVADNRERAIEPARRAVALDAEDAGARCTLGRIHYLRREHGPAIMELEAALELNPSLALAHYGLGAALVFSGRASESFPHLETAIRLSPHDPNMGSFLVRSADAKYFMRDYEDAVAWAVKALRQPNFQWSRYAVLLAALGQLGRVDEAKRHLQDLLGHRPDFTVSFVRDTHLFGNSEDFDHYLDGLRKAGVPE
jgi:adenylate cyclase